MSQFLQGIWTSVIEYETPRLVKIHNRKLGLARRLIQISIITYVLVYALFLQKGYQEFTRVESSVTVKIKGVTKSELGAGTNLDQSLYTRVWDVADYVVPPAENGAFFVATNVIITPNQTRGTCPEDYLDVDNVECVPDRNNCTMINGVKKCRGLQSECPENATFFKAHGPLTGYCILSDRPGSNGTYSCEVQSWCPIEVDKLPLGNVRALMQKAEEYTVFIKNSVAFPYFGDDFSRNNLIGNNGRPCIYGSNEDHTINNGCQIFKLGDMVTYAGGNFSQIAIKGGVIAVSIKWNCNLDRDFQTYCLPLYAFRILDDFGWNFRHAKYHEENRRSLYKMYGIKFILTVEGRGGKFNLKNTILNIGSGLALLGVSTVVCDFLLMYIKEKGVVKKKKYDYIDVQELLAAREESRRKVQENQLRRRSIISNFSRRWTRKTITNPGSNTRPICNSRRQTTLLTHRAGNSNLNNHHEIDFTEKSHPEYSHQVARPPVAMEEAPTNPEKISLTLSVEENNFGAKIQNSSASAMCNNTSTTPTTNTVMKDSVSSTTILPRDSSQYSIHNNNGSDNVDGFPQFVRQIQL